MHFVRRHHRSERAALVLASLLAPVVLAPTTGCDDDRGPAAPGRGAHFAGRLLGTESGLGVGPYPLSLYDLDAFAPIARTWSDAEGGFAFRRVPPGDYLPVVHALDRVLFHLPQPRWSLEEGDSVDVLLLLAPTPAGNPTELRLRGHVVDEATGAPIAGAQVEMTVPRQGLNFSEMRGSSTPLETITDPGGHFEIGPLPLLLAPDGGDPVTPSWRVSHPGYLDRWFEGYPQFAVPESVTVRLGAGAEAHGFTGRVTTVDGAPVAHVVVAAEWRRGEGALTKLVVETVPTRTDADGRYRLVNLPAGAFNLRAGILPDDGWVGETTRGQGLAITSTDTLVAAPDLFVAPAVVPLQPPDAEVVATPPRLRWEAVPGATTYQVRVTRQIDGLSATGSSEEAEVATEGVDFFAEAGLYVWQVTAFGDRGELTRTERPRAWVLQPPPASPPGGAPPPGPPPGASPAWSIDL